MMGLSLLNIFTITYNIDTTRKKKKKTPPQFKPPAWVYVFLVLPNDVLDPYLTRAKPPPPPPPPPISSWGPAGEASHSATRPRISDNPPQLPTTNGYPGLFRLQRAHSIHFAMSTQRISFLVGFGDSGRRIAIVGVKGRRL